MNAPASQSPQTAEISNVVALLDIPAGTYTLQNQDEPTLRVNDLAPHRGDGIFETVLVSVRADGAHVHNRQPHFLRFRESAHALDLPVPQAAQWDEALDAAIAEFTRRNPGITTFSVRYAMSRGIDGGDPNRPSGWILTIPIPAKYATQRTQGISIVTLNKGFPAYFGQSAPWTLLGAKTLSYAINQAAGREAAKNGADDALFHSHDGLFLEGPTSNLIIKRGDQLITPDPKTGLLHGTTQQTIFTEAAAAGFDVSYADIDRDALLSADAVWMVSSTRLAAPVRAIDGEEIAVDEDLTNTFNEWVLAAS